MKDGGLDEVRDLLAPSFMAATSGGRPEFAEVLRQRALLHRLRQLWGYADCHGYNGALPGRSKSGCKPEGFVPARDLGEVLSLRLRIAYQLMIGLEKHSEAMRDAETIIATVCRDPRVKRRDAKRFCEFLLLRPPDPPPAAVEDGGVPTPRDGGVRLAVPQDAGIGG